MNMKKYKSLFLVILVVTIAFILSGCADITVEKWINEDKTEDEVRGKISTDYRQFYAMVKEEWVESGIDYSATEEGGLYIIEFPRTQSSLVEDVDGETSTDITQYTKEKSDDESITYTFDSDTSEENFSSDDSSEGEEWGEEMMEAMMAGYKFKWIVHFPTRVVDVKLEGSEYEVLEEDYSGRTVKLEMPLKEIPEKIIVTTK